MRALHLGPTGPALVDLPFTVRPGEARVRVHLAGVCATDLELVKGYMGFAGTLGHEWVGVVEAAPDAAWVGKRVVGDINCPCGACPTCLAGRPTHCPTRTVLGILGRDGAFAEHLSLPTANLHVVPDAVPDDAAVFVEPLAAACQILEQVHVRPSHRVVVLGTGRLGQLCARVLALSGAEVAAVGRNPVTLALLPSSVRAFSLADAPALAGADIVVDCTGNPDGLALATSLVRPGGTLVLKTTVHDVGRIEPNRWVIDEITVVGSRCGPFEPALRLLAAGLVDPRPLITARLPLEQGVAALEMAAQPGVVKVLLG
ncbi:MAG: alcohol dehydrogenase catalytic domain-containing protein [Myxococcota bacterium]